MTKLTVIILTANEEKNIVEVIGNAKLVTDDILVVDSGSKDNTVNLARKCGARVIYRAWDNDFAAQRNYALGYTDAKWVLYLDADERMDNIVVAAINSIVSNDSSDNLQYSFVRRIHAFGMKYRYGIFKPDEVLRLFPNKLLYWENKVHERPVCNVPQKVLPGYVDHYTYSCWQDWWDKVGKYTTIWAEDVYKKGKRTNLFACFGHALYGFFRAYILQLGFLDGWSGLYSSWQHASYTLLKYLKLEELQRFNKDTL